jgi:DNA-binding NarL/FixJ family response regulator
MRSIPRRDPNAPRGSAISAAVRQCHGHRMRGTALLLDRDKSLRVDLDVLRANGLTVYECQEAARALEQVQRMPPDLVVAVLAAHDSASIVTDLRALADPATSIIVVSVPAQREAAREAGADLFLLHSAPPADLEYEMHRALILRRSGRRLPWTQ